MKKKLLVVDEDKNMCELLKIEFGDQGYLVTGCSDPDLVTTLLKGNEFDAVILDLKAPWLGGHKLLNQIDTLKISVPIIVHSGFTLFENYIADKRYTQFVLKSSDLSRLKRAVGNLAGVPTRQIQPTLPRSNRRPAATGKRLSTMNHRQLPETAASV